MSGELELHPRNAPQKLAAILFADIAGYSQLMDSDEAGTLETWRSARAEVIGPTVAEHGGRIVKFTGDGFLAEFNTAESALACAVSMQEVFSGNEFLKLRVGVHLGDIYVEGDDIYGDGVNVAARLEGLAEAGGICVSGVVRDLVHKKMPLRFVDAGRQKLKNIAEPLQVWRITPRIEATHAAASAADNRPSIAVLPFDNMSGDPEQEYFADGLVEDIITELSRFRWLTVMARNSSFVYKGRAVDVRQASRELNVRYVLEGSVRKLGPRVRITGQLIEAESGAHCWADKFDGNLDGIFDILDDVTRGVVCAIEPSVRQAEIKRSKRKRPESLDAFDYYLRALSRYYLYTAEGRADARHLLDQALAHDPEYAEAHGLAAIVATQSSIWDAKDAEGRDRALGHARAVKDSGSDDASSLAFAAWAFAVAGEVDTALGMVEEALAHNPNSSDACTWGAFIHLMRCSSERGLALAERALKLNPFDPLRYVSLHAVATAKLYLDDGEGSLDAARRTLQDNPNYAPAYMLQITGLVRLGRIAEARQALARLSAIAPGLTLGGFARTFGFIANIDEMVAAMRAAGMPD